MHQVWGAVMQRQGRQCGPRTAWQPGPQHPSPPAQPRSRHVSLWTGDSSQAHAERTFGRTLHGRQGNRGTSHRVGSAQVQRLSTDFRHATAIVPQPLPSAASLPAGHVLVRRAYAGARGFPRLRSCVTMLRQAHGAAHHGSQPLHGGLSCMPALYRWEQSVALR